MILRMLAVSLCAVWLTACSQDPAPVAPKASGQFTVAYIPPKHKKLRDTYRLLQKEQILEEFANGFNDYLALPRNIALTTAECGEVNAYYNAENHSIVLCYEFVEDLIEQSDDPDFDEEDSENFIAGTLMFVLLHEVGHALTHVLDLPVTGKEEDAVDQLAAVLLIDDAGSEEEFDQNVEYVAHAASWFWGLNEEEYGTEAFADEHSLGEQRYYNMMCWIYGAKPESGQDIIDDELLPESRAEKCPAEYQQISKSWDRLLKPYIKG